jgi:predicted secreted protein
MAASTGFDASIYNWTGGTCTTALDKLSITGGTCTKIGDLDSYTKNFTRETIDVTAFGDKIRKVISGFPSASVSGSGSFNFADAQQVAIHTAMESTSAQTEKILILKESGCHTVMKGYITGDSSGSSVGGKSTFSFEFASNTVPNTTA